MFFFLFKRHFIWLNPRLDPVLKKSLASARRCARACWVGGKSRVLSLPVAALIPVRFQLFSRVFQRLAVIRCEAEASWLCPPTSCFRGSRKDSRFLQIRRVFFGSRTFWLEPQRSHTRVMATSHGEYRGYLRNTIDMEAGQNRFQPVPTSESTYRSILFGTLVIMGLLQVASSIALLLHLTGYLQEVRLKLFVISTASSSSTSRARVRKVLFIKLFLCDFFSPSSPNMAFRLVSILQSFLRMYGAP